MNPIPRKCLFFPALAATLVGTLLTACNPTPARHPTTLSDLRNAVRQSPHPKILWIGNSYSFGAPALVQSLAHQRGQSLECQQVTHSGWSLSRHARNPETLQAIRSQRWDIIVLQEQSRRPSVPWRLYFQSLPAAASLTREIRRSGALPALCQTWGYRGGDPSRKTDSFTSMNQRLRQGYHILGNTLGVPIIPVGDSWESALAAATPPNVFQSDGKHPSHQGDLLIAKTFVISILHP
jgi:hypothetical protein